MNKFKNISLINLIIFSVFFLVFTSNAMAADGLLLYTTYTGLSVTPGETLEYSIEVINNTDTLKNVSFSLVGLPEGWDYSINSLGKDITRLAIKPREFENDNDENINLEIEVPLQVQKGDYQFQVVATTASGLKYYLPLTVTVAEKGVFKTEFTTEQSNMEGYADSDFSYKTTLKNRTAEKQHYALTAEPPRGWDVRFRVSGDYVTSVTVDSNESKTVYVNVKPPTNVKADTYNINVRASSGQTSEEINLETVIKGKYDLSLSTPTGLLSADIKVGGKKNIKLEVENTGTVTLRDIKLDSSTPINWNVKFDEKEITKLEPGEKTTVNAEITASDKAIAGDYQLVISADTPETSSTKTFRITVKTSLLWGWVGILIILAVLAVIYYFVRKYGRR
jgi:uncharacterized membrane protein